VGERINH
jgi:hypothetical protein